MSTIARAHIEQVSAASPHVMRVKMRLKNSVGFLPGQYLMLVHRDGASIPFSIASPPYALPRLELHYEPVPGSDDEARLEDLIWAGNQVDLDLPHGNCGVDVTTDQPLLLVAGGTGMAQAHSIALAALEHGRRPVRLYFGNASNEELYCANELDELDRIYPQFSWRGCVDEGPARGRFTGHAADAAAADVRSGALSLENAEVVLCGGPPMVAGSVHALRDVGLTREQTRADAFDYAPDPALWY